MLRAALTSWTESVGLTVDEASWSRLDALVQLWQRYGPALNLLGAYDPASLAEHVREGLAARRVAELAAGGRGDVAWIDVGSGAGLPGLVVAATTPWSMALVEPRAKRAAFLELAAATVAGGEARVSRARLVGHTWDDDALIGEILGRDPSIVVASARAVFGPEAWLEMARRALPARGVVLVHVGSAVADIAGEAPTWRVDAGRWAVLGFPVVPSGIGAPPTGS
jgi:16S rRNA G527 N7-methylase RsmG